MNRPAKLVRLARARLRVKKAGTRKLKPQLVAVIEQLHDRFFASSGLAPYREGALPVLPLLRERALRSDELAHIQAAVEAMAADALKDALERAMQTMYVAGQDSAFKELGDAAPEPGSMLRVHSRALKSIDAYTAKLSDTVIDRERDVVLDLVRDAVSEGWTIDELAEQIQAAFADGVHVGGNEDARVIATGDWAEMVARTEVSRAHNAGAIDLYRAAGGEKMEFIAAEDERMCDECGDLDGQTFALDDEEGTPPIHPECRCCTALRSKAAASSEDE